MTKREKAAVVKESVTNSDDYFTHGGINPFSQILL